LKFSYLIGKIAADKDLRKLGKIVTLERLPANDEQDAKLVEVLIIHVHRLFKKDIGVPISCEKILKIQEKYVVFDLTKEEFKSCKVAKEIIAKPKGDKKDEEKWKVKWGSFITARDEH
jgi:hypothetical protein